MNALATPPESSPRTDVIEKRLAELRHEYEAGQAQLGALEQRTRELKNTMMRISGAITVLEEVLAERQAIGE